MDNPKILVIEDTQSIREELEDILIFEEMNVLTAENGQKGIDLAKNERPDLILCDIMMPVKDGYEVFMEIQHSPLQHTPFIFLTAKATHDNIREGMILGADDYITKPFNIDLLVNSIKSRLAKDAKRKKEEKERRKTLQLSISRAIPHELLTPLNGIIGFSELLSDPIYSFSIKEIRDVAEQIHNSGQRLHDTIKKFIYYTEIELLINDPLKHDSLKAEVVEKGSLVLANQCFVVAEKHNRSSDLEIEPDFFDLKMSLSHFEIILSNIIDNAFKFSEKGEKVHIYSFKKDGFVNIMIEDSGIGLDADKKKEIEAFSQFNRAKMEQQGLGLGLITSIKLVEFYGGTINWIKKPDKGTSVRISLVLAE